MALVDDFVGSVTTCMDPPSLDLFGELLGPYGFQNTIGGLFFTAFAGINYVLDFIPPDPGNLPSIPRMDLFLNAMLGSLNFPANHPEIDFGFGIVFPEVTDGDDVDFDISGAFKLFAIFIKVPFDILEFIINKIIDDLEVGIPGVPDIILLLETAALNFGLSLNAGINLCFGCVATALYNLFADLLL